MSNVLASPDESLLIDDAVLILPDRVIERGAVRMAGGSGLVLLGRAPWRWRDALPLPDDERDGERLPQRERAARCGMDVRPGGGASGASARTGEPAAGLPSNCWQC